MLFDKIDFVFVFRIWMYSGLWCTVGELWMYSARACYVCAFCF